MKRTWYHSSEINHGTSFISELRVPECISINEPKTPRLCVASTIARCFTSRLFVKEVYVYKCRCSAVPAKNVWDSLITREHWIIHRQKMELDRIIPQSQVENYCLPIQWYHHRTKKNSNLRLRACTYALAVKYIHATPVDERQIEKMLKILKINDPEEYFFEKIACHGKPGAIRPNQ